MKTIVLSAAALAPVVALTAETQAQQAVQWRVEDGGNGHWYGAIAHADPFDWNDARATAQSQGAHLVSVTSPAEWQFVKAIADQPSLWNGGHGPWMGAFQNRQSSSYSEPAGGWEWVTGEPFAWTSWWTAGPQPSDSCDGWHEDFLHIIDRAAMAWNDIGLPGTCSVYPPVSAIVEWDADCNNDGIVDYGQIRAGLLPDANGNNIPDCCEGGMTCCLGDILRDGRVDGADLAAVLSHWGTVTSDAVSVSCDLDHSGTVDGNDLGMLLAHWGPCGS